MANLYGKNFNKEELLPYIGSFSQIAGSKTYKYINGKEGGVKAIEVKTGSGFNFIVLPDRGMDIANTEYCGKPISWISKNGIVSSSHFEAAGFGWLRSFTGGLLTTCGLTQVGLPCTDNGEELGLHGRISNTPAENFWTEEYWDGDEYIIKVKGKVRESNVYSENLLLEREIITKLGDEKLIINDIVENQGYNDTPLMIMYHMNFGFPIVSENSHLYTSAVSVEPFNDDAKKNNSFNSFEKPTSQYQYQLYSHNMPREKDKVFVALINESLNFGAYILYSPKQLPYFNQWKLLDRQDYVVGLEPGNTLPEGRPEARKNNRLVIIKPGEKYNFNFEIGVIKDKNDIDKFKKNWEFKNK